MIFRKTLRAKTLALVSVLIAGIVAAVFLISSLVIMPSFKKLEIESAKADAVRIRDAIVADKDALKSLTWDYAQWSDTYRFAKDLNPAYIEDNIIPDTFESLRIDLFAIFDTSGNLVFARAYNRGADKFERTPVDLEERVKEHPVIFKAVENKELIGGFIRTENGPLLVGTRGISETDGSGKIDHVIVFGYYFSQPEVNEISEQTHIQATVYDLASPALTAEALRAESALLNTATFYTEIDGPDSFDIFTLEHDLNGDPLMLIQGDIPRSIYQTGTNTVFYFVLAMMGVCLLFGMIAYQLMDRTIVRRIEKIASEVKEIGQDGTYDEHITVQGHDEITSLAETLDKTYCTLNESLTALAESEELFSSISHSASDAIVLVDAEGLIKFWNESAEELFTHKGGATVNKLKIGDVIPDERATIAFKRVAGAFGEAGTSTVAPFESYAVRQDGTEFPIEVSLSPTHVHGRSHVVAILRDISERKAFELVRHMSRHDELTQLPNRPHFLEYTRKLMAVAKRKDRMLAVHYLDIDYFKDLNDVLAMNFGDMVLIAVGKRLEQATRKEDMVARLGGDEFAVVQTEINSHFDAAQFAERLATALRERFIVEGEEVFLTASIGVSVFPEQTLRDTSGEDPAELLKMADIAMYAAKSAGRNTYQMFDQSMGDLARQRLELVRDLRKALENGELFLEYQPQFELRTGRLIGAECLIRWEKPGKGCIMPGAFIPAAEFSGLILPMGEWALREACIQNMKWQDKGLPPIRVGVNFSVIQFRRQNVVELVRSVLRETGMNGKWLDVELTESLLAENVQDTIDKLHGLHGLNTHLSIDDFGTGYTSLSYIQHFPIDTIKVDGTFIRDLGTGKNKGVVAAAAIKLGQNLGVEVIAECVENEEQAAFLRTLDCDQVQGYHFGRPVKADEFERLYLTKNTSS